MVNAFSAEDPTMTAGKRGETQAMSPMRAGRQYGEVVMLQYTEIYAIRDGRK